MTSVSTEGVADDQHDRNLGDPRAHHRHVAGVIVHAVFLLVGRVVLLIDDDQAEVRIRQEQRRARADDHADLAGATAAPGARALARRQLRMPFGRPDAEARGEAIEELRRQRDLRHQDQRLPAAADDLGHRLEIDLGLARTGDAVEQRHAENRLLRTVCAQRIRGRALRRREVGREKVRIGRRATGSGGSTSVSSVPSSTRPSITPGETPASCAASRLAARQPVGEQREHARARRGHALRRRPGKPHADPLARRTEMLAHAQRHAQHHAARR